MGEIVNLRSVKRRQARAGDAAQAATNRARFGRTPAERARDQRREERADNVLDGAHLDAPAEPRPKPGPTGA